MKAEANGRSAGRGKFASSIARVSYIRAFHVRDWVRLASELGPRAEFPGISISRRRGQRIA